MIRFCKSKSQTRKITPKWLLLPPKVKSIVEETRLFHAV